MTSITSALILGLCAIASTGAKYTTFSVFDHYSNNTLRYNDFYQTFSQKGFYNFDYYTDFVHGFNMYGDKYPLLIVYQPDQNIPELHGYFFSEGFSTFRQVGKEYEPIHKYFEKYEVEAYTPFAVYYRCPQFYNYKLTTFVHTGAIKPYFAVWFVVPKTTHDVNFINYFEIDRYTPITA